MRGGISWEKRERELLHGVRIKHDNLKQFLHLSSFMFYVISILHCFILLISEKIMNVRLGM